MNKSNLDSDLISRLEALKSTPARDPQAAARGRSRFLAEASEIRATASIGRKQRHTGWNLIFHKEIPTMKALTSALIVLLILAGATTVFAAQASLPTDPLYGVKTLSEDISLSLTTGPERHMERVMELARVRTREMTMLVEQGQDVPEKVALRLHLHIEKALQIAAGQPDGQMQGSLLQLQAQLQIQEQVMTQLQARASDQSQPVLAQARIKTREQLGYANQGLADPAAFRYRYLNQNANEFGAPESTPSGEPNATGTPNVSATGPGPNAQGTPDAGYGPNPTAGAGYGPNPTAGSGYGPNPEPGTGNGPNPTPMPGNSPNPTPGGGHGPNPTPIGGATANPSPGTGGKP